MNARWAQTITEPYRLFFPLGILLALGGVGHWLFYAAGWMGRYYGYLHASIQVMLYLPCFIGGFLMTAVPRFSGTRPCRGWEIAASLAAIAGVTATLFFGFWIAAESFYILWILLTVRFVASRFVKRQVQFPPVDFVWILPAVLLGLAGALAIVLVQAGILPPERMSAGRAMQEQGFTLALVLGIGGFLGPRLMGAHSMPAADARTFKIQLKNKLLLNLAFALMLLASFALEWKGLVFAAYELRALTVAGVLLWKGALNSKVVSGPSLFIRLLSVSFWMIALGYLSTAFFPKIHKALIHFVFLGGFSLMIYCVSTMVVLSHGGRGELLHRPMWIFRVIAAGTAVSLAFRLAAPVFPEHYFSLLGAASVTWLAMGAAWLVFAAPHLSRLADPAAVAAAHDRAVRETGSAC